MRSIEKKRSCCWWFFVLYFIAHVFFPTELPSFLRLSFIICLSLFSPLFSFFYFFLSISSLCILVLFFFFRFFFSSVLTSFLFVSSSFSRKERKGMPQEMGDAEDCTMVQNNLTLRHQMIYFPSSSGVSERASEQTNKRSGIPE